MRKIGYLISIVGLLLLCTVKIGQAHGKCRLWDRKRDEWLQDLPRLSRGICRAGVTANPSSGVIAYLS